MGRQARFRVRLGDSLGWRARRPTAAASMAAVVERAEGDSPRPKPSEINVALGGTPSQSSLSRWSRDDDARGAISGSKTGTFGFHTDSEPRPWWQVDLGRTYLLNRIELYNQEELEESPAARLSVLVSEDERAWQKVYTGSCLFGGVRSGSPLVVYLDCAVVGRYVRVQLETYGCLHLDEVEVWSVRELDDLRHLFVERGWKFGRADANPNDHRYARPHYYLFDHDGSEHIHTVELVNWRPLGNGLRQLVNAIHVARHTGAVALRVPPRSPYAPERAHELPNLRLESSDAPSSGSPGSTLRGDFFYADEAFADLFEAFSADDYAEVVQRDVAPIVRGRLASSLRFLTQDELVVHFRSGDIFGSRPHPGYVPPPLAFYEIALEEHLRRCPTSPVLIVTEDRGNPSIAAFEDLLQQKGIRYEFRSQSATEDFALLMSARYLVGSVGSFCLAAGLLAEHLRTYYAFRLDSGSSLQFDALVAKLAGGVVNVFNRAGYIEYGQWTGSPEQRELILSYPRMMLSTSPTDPPGPPRGT